MDFLKPLVRGAEFLQKLAQPLEEKNVWGLSADLWLHFFLAICLTLLLRIWFRRASFYILCAIFLKEFIDLGIYEYYGSTSIEALIDSSKDLLMGLFGLVIAVFAIKLKSHLLK